METVKRISYGSWTDLRFVPGAILSRGVLITVLSLLTVFKSSTPGLPPPLRQGEAVFSMQKTLRCPLLLSLIPVRQSA